MPKHLSGIDHCVILVRDLDRAAAAWRRLGFTLSPRGYHSAKMGSANHTLMLQSDYFELLGLVAETEHNVRWRSELARGEGLTAIALATDDAHKACAELRGLGIAASDPLDFSRPVDLPGGGRADAAFQVTEFPEGAIPGAQMFVCGHLTRDAVWIPELQRHDNTARSLAEIVCLAADPAAAAAGWARIFGTAAISDVPGGKRVRAGSHTVSILTPSGLVARYRGVAVPDSGRDRPVALAFTVADLAAARRTLLTNGVVFTEIGDSLVVPPGQASGTVAEFRPA